MVGKLGCKGVVAARRGDGVAGVLIKAPGTRLQEASNNTTQQEVIENSLSDRTGFFIRISISGIQPDPPTTSTHCCPRIYHYNRLIYTGRYTQSTPITPFDRNIWRLIMIDLYNCPGVTYRPGNTWMASEAIFEGDDRA
jgi:hypothetical protein